MRTGAADSLARTAVLPIPESACETAAVNRCRLAVGANSVTTADHSRTFDNFQTSRKMDDVNLVTTADHSRTFDNRGSAQSAAHDPGTENGRIPVLPGQQ